MRTFIFVLLLLVSLIASGQGFKPLSSDDIPGLLLVNTDTFTSQNLALYAPDRKMFCTEFGFRTLYVMDYELNGESARFEIFVLEDPPSALGLFSISADSCMRRGLYTSFSCKQLTRFSAALGPMYLNAFSAINSSRQNMSELLISRFISKNPQEQWFFPPLFTLPKLSPYLGSLKYTRGPVSLAIGVPELNDLLEDTQFSCYSIIINDPSYTGILVRLQFPDFNEAGSFLVKSGVSLSDGATPVLSANGFYRSWYKIDDTKLIYLECSSAEFTIMGIIPERQDPMYQYLNR